MSASFEDARPVENRADLAAALERGGKPRSAWRIGTEHEKLGFRVSDHRPLPYDDQHGPSIRKMLNGLTRFDWEPILEDGNPIALKREGASISLEPGGQFELSGAPVESVHDTCVEVSRHLREVREVADETGAAFLGLGFAPTWALADMPMMPKSRYQIMKSYMPKVGGLGLDMMFRTATVQTNLDFLDEADMALKLRVSLALQPIATALFANSPFTEGRPNGFLSYRSHIWSDTDPKRTGMLAFAFEEGFGFEHYVDFALDAPMYFVVRDGKLIDASGESFRAFLDGKLPQLPGQKPTMGDWETHLSTIFPEVRLKTFLEMRGADSGPWSSLCALPAFWAGILYDSGALAAAWDMVKDWTAEERQTLRNDVPKLGLKARFRHLSAQEVAVEALRLARAGLRSRARLNGHGENESIFLAELEETAQSGVTPAERLLARYRGPWGRDLDPLFRERAF
jgi:glutamate--cysteine ligase